MSVDMKAIPSAVMASDVLDWISTSKLTSNDMPKKYLALRDLKKSIKPPITSKKLAANESSNVNGLIAPILAVSRRVAEFKAKSAVCKKIKINAQICQVLSDLVSGLATSDSGDW